MPSWPSGRQSSKSSSCPSRIASCSQPCRTCSSSRRKQRGHPLSSPWTHETPRLWPSGPLQSCSTSSNGQGHEGNESDGRHEGDEGHEEKVSEQDWKRPHGQSLGVPRVEGEDHWRLDCFCFDEEQVR